MLKIAVLCCGAMMITVDHAQAQDIAGVEDCTKTSGLDKRTGCLQSNVNFLQQLVTKSAADARQKIEALTQEMIVLKSKVISLQSLVEQLQAAQKGASEKKPESK